MLGASSQIQIGWQQGQGAGEGVQVCGQCLGVWSRTSVLLTVGGLGTPLPRRGRGEGERTMLQGYPQMVMNTSATDGAGQEWGWPRSTAPPPLIIKNTPRQWRGDAPPAP